MKPTKVFRYREFDIKQNPLTGDWYWIMYTGENFGAYVGCLSEMKKTIDEHYRHKAKFSKDSQ